MQDRLGRDPAQHQPAVSFCRPSVPADAPAHVAASTGAARWLLSCGSDRPRSLAAVVVSQRGPRRSAFAGPLLRLRALPLAAPLVPAPLLDAPLGVSCPSSPAATTYFAASRTGRQRPLPPGLLDAVLLSRRVPLASQVLDDGGELLRRRDAVVVRDILAAMTEQGTLAPLAANDLDLSCSVVTQPVGTPTSRSSPRDARFWTRSPHLS